MKTKLSGFSPLKILKRLAALNCQSWEEKEAWGLHKKVKMGNEGVRG